MRKWIQENEYVDYNFRFWEPAYFNNLLQKIYAKLEYLKEHIDKIENGQTIVPSAGSINGKLCVENKNGEGLVNSLAFTYPALIKYSKYGLTFIDGQLAFKSGSYALQNGLYYALPKIEVKSAKLYTSTGTGEKELSINATNKWIRIYINGAQGMYLDANYTTLIEPNTVTAIPVIASNPKLRILGTANWEVYINVIEYGEFEIVKGKVPYFYKAQVSGDVAINREFILTTAVADVPLSYKWEDKEILLQRKELPGLSIKSGTLRVFSDTLTDVIIMGNEVI